MTKDYKDELITGRDDEDVIRRAKARFKRAMDWESEFRQRAVEDMKFLVGDSDNGYQWPASMRQQRQGDNRPCLTINKVHQHWLSVVNDGKQNKPSVTIHPTGSAATYQAAQCFESVIRHIEYRSNAQNAYDKASESQVGCGIGYWRVDNDYVADNSFDQEIFIRPIPDSTQVLLDPDIKETDGSDANFGFVFTDLAKATFLKQWPDESEYLRSTPLEEGGWIGPEKIRIAEYFEVREVNDVLYAVMGPNGVQQYIQRSQMTPGQIEQVRDREDIFPRRRIKRREVWKYFIAGTKVLESGRIPCKYIPIVRVIGEEMIVDGKLERKGLVRYMKDPQRMYNYNSSAQVEIVAMQSKSPFVAPLDAIDGLENYWNSANKINFSVLPYNAYDEQGRQVPPPQRASAPSSSEGYQTGLETAAEEMRMVSGQYDAMMGAPSNEQSGIAITRRQRQGDRATYHFIDGLAKAIRFTGKILIDMIPQVYDTRRIFRVMGENGNQHRVMIDPSGDPFAHLADHEGPLMIFNPSVGAFDVTSDVGPSWQTQREETLNAVQQILAANPSLTQVIGDLFFRAADFPLADEMAERMQRWIPGYLLGNGPTPQEQQAMQQIQQLTQKLQELQAKSMRDDIEKARLRDDGQARMAEIMQKEQNHERERMEEQEQKRIDEYDAETRRLKVLSDNFLGVANLSTLATQEERLIEGSANRLLDNNCSTAIDGLSNNI